MNKCAVLFIDKQSLLINGFILALGGIFGSTYQITAVPDEVMDNFMVVVFSSI